MSRHRGWRRAVWRLGKLWEHSVCPDMHKVKACFVICRLWDKVR